MEDSAVNTSTILMPQVKTQYPLKAAKNSRNLNFQPVQRVNPRSFNFSKFDGDSPELNEKFYDLSTENIMTSLFVERNLTHEF